MNLAPELRHKILHMLGPVDLVCYSRVSEEAHADVLDKAYLIPILFAQALKTVEEIEGDKTELLKKIAEAQVLCGEISEAKKTIKETYCEVEILMKIAQKLAESEDFSGAEETLDEAIAAANRIHPQMKASALRNIAKMQSGDRAKATFALAVVAANEMRNTIKKNEALKMIAIVQAESGDLRGAKETANGIRDWLTKEEALRAIAIAQAESGDINGAKETVELLSLKVSALKEIARIQTRRNDIKGAKETANQIPSLKDEVFGEIAEAQVQNEDIRGAKETVGEIALDMLSKALALKKIAQAESGEEARETFRQAIRAANQIEEFFSVNAVVLRRIAKAQAESGDVPGAKETLSQARAFANEMQNGSGKVSVLCQIAQTQVDCGELNDLFAPAIAVAEQMENGVEKAKAFKEIVDYLVEEEEISRVIEIAKKIENADYLKTDLIKSLANKGEITGAKAIAKQIKDQFTRENGLVEIAKTQNGSEAKETAEQIHDAVIKGRAYMEIAKAQAQREEISEAKETVQWIGMDHLKDEALRVIAQNEEISPGKETVKQIQRPYSKVLALVEMAHRSISSRT